MLTVEVDIAAVRQNIGFIRNKVHTGFCAVVKADAYGHGIEGISAFIEDYVDCFAVATAEEALKLSAVGIRKDILILGCENEIRHCLPENVIPTLCSAPQAEEVKGKAVAVSIAVNTGMNRLGCRPDETRSVFLAALNCGLNVRGIFTHFYNESDKTACADQFSEFLSCALPLRESVRYLHCCASNCLIMPEVYHLDMVRVGLAMYGYGYEGVKPAMNIYTAVIQITSIKAGERIGYGDCAAKNDMRLATLRVGYGDGFRRIDNAFVSINGKKCDIVGRICMDMCMADVTNVVCKVGDRAYILGNGIKMEDICKIHNTISHEVLTMINERAERIYVE
jgi:alanine racemase